MRVLEMVGSDEVTTPAVSMCAASRAAASSRCSVSVAPEAGEQRLAAEAGEVHGDVGGAAGSLVAVRVAEDGDGGFGGDAVDVADDVAIEHEVADDEDTDVVEAAFEEAEDAVEFGKHSKVRIARHRTRFDEGAFTKRFCAKKQLHRQMYTVYTFHVYGVYLYDSRS